MVNPNQITINELATYLHDMNIQLEIIPYSQWREKLYSAFMQKKENVLFPLLDLFAESLEEMPRLRYKRHIDCQNLLTALNGTSIQFPQVDYAFLSSFITKFLTST